MSLFLFIPNKLYDIKNAAAFDFIEGANKVKWLPSQCRIEL